MTIIRNNSEYFIKILSKKFGEEYEKYKQKSWL